MLPEARSGAVAQALFLLSCEQNDEALSPYMDGKLDQQTALTDASIPVREFMIGQIISSRAGIQVAPTVIDRESAGPQALKQTDSRLRSGHRSLAREYPAISGRPTFAPGDDTSGLA